MGGMSYMDFGLALASEGVLLVCSLVRLVNLTFFKLGLLEQALCSSLKLRLAQIRLLENRQLCVLRIQLSSWFTGDPFPLSLCIWASVAPSTRPRP